MQASTIGVTIYQCIDRNVQCSATKHQVLMCAKAANVKYSKNNDMLKSASVILYAYATNKVPRSVNVAMCAGATSGVSTCIANKVCKHS